MNAQQRLDVARAHGLPWNRADERERNERLHEEVIVWLIRANAVMVDLVAIVAVNRFGWTPARYLALLVLGVVVIVTVASARWVYRGRRDQLG